LTPVVGDYVLTAENLITGSLVDDDVAMGGYHIGIHRPSRSVAVGLRPPGHRRRVARR
jgi:hypothetical protein